MGQEERNKEIEVKVTRTSSSDSTATSLKSPRTPRFAEATSVNSPIEPPQSSRAPFDDRTTSYIPQPQPSDIGFGYIGNDRRSGLAGQAVEMPLTPKSPLKSALKSPGAPPREIKQNPLSPTWKEEEEDLEKQEQVTEKEQAKDLKVKIRVRIAKMALRFTNFSCSLIVLSMLASAFQIFNATKHLPPRNSLPPWAQNTARWPAILLLCIACVSLFMSVVIFYGYLRGGHRRAEKVAVYYTTFAVGFFIFSIVMWGIGAGVLNQGKNIRGGQDMWGWSCKTNPRKQVFQQEVNYDLVCRLMNWSLVCCIIEVVVEVITIAIYGIVFYRYYSKRRLRKTMARRDTARSDLYLAQLRSQSAPNTPGLKSPGFPLSPREGGYNPAYSPRFAHLNGGAEKSLAAQPSIDQIATAGAEDPNTRYITAPANPAPSQPFTLQAPPPKKSTPKLSQSGFETTRTAASSSSEEVTTSSAAATAPQITVQAASPRSPALSPWTEARQESEPQHQPAAPGETQYESVPIPGAYASPLASPAPVGGMGTQQQQYFGHAR